MFNKANLFAASCTVLLLAACGGSSSDNNDERPTFEQLTTRGAALNSRLSALEETTVMPTTGSATYNGVALFDMGSDEHDMLSELSLQANFADSTVGGKFSNFVTEDGSQMDGELNVADGVMNQQAFDAAVTGTLRDGDKSSTFDGTMNGAFHGENAAAVAGTMAGSVDGTLADGASGFGGFYVAEK